MKDTRFAKLVLVINGLVPLVLLLWDVWRRRAGANPTQFVTHTTGMLALVFLTTSLAVTPVRRVTGANWLVTLRRALGLFAFFYGALHLVTYVAFDRFLDLKSVPADVLKRPFIAVGMMALLLMIPLALTSTAGSIRRLGGKRWQMLHRAVYASAVLGVIHYYWLVKSDIRKPVFYGALVAILLAWRLWSWIAKKKAPAQVSSLRATKASLPLPSAK